MARPSFARAARAAYAVHIDLRVARELKVDDGWKVIDIQSAGGNICGHQDAAAALLELNQYLVAVALLHIAVQRTCAWIPAWIEAGSQTSRASCLVLQNTTAACGPESGPAAFSSAFQATAFRWQI